MDVDSAASVDQDVGHPVRRAGVGSSRLITATRVLLPDLTLAAIVAGLSMIVTALCVRFGTGVRSGGWLIVLMVGGTVAGAVVGGWWGPRAVARYAPGLHARLWLPERQNRA